MIYTDQSNVVRSHKFKKHIDFFYDWGESLQSVFVWNFFSKSQRMTRLELYLGRVIKSEILYRYFCFIAIRIHFNITIYTLHTRYVDIQLFQLDNSKSLDDKKVGFRYHQKSIEICLRFHPMKFSALKKIPCFLSFHVSGIGHVRGLGTWSGGGGGMG